MRIIQVIGKSGSGKTTFILKLTALLKKCGVVASVKHLGHHTYALEEGKDTTLHYSAGTAATAGIDGEKSVLTLRTTSLEQIIEILCDTGADFLIIEGYKTTPFPAIVIGDLAAENCVMRNPAPEEVFSSLHLFAEFKTTKRLVAELMTRLSPQDDHSFITCAIPIGNSYLPRPSGTTLRTPDVPAVTSNLAKIPGVAGMSVACNNGIPGFWNPSFLIALVLDNPLQAAGVVSVIAGELKGFRPDISISCGTR
jgi:molybdopterin-guanine dinucleotide biosynthesis protein MobB